MARLAHCSKVRFVVALGSVAKMRYRKADLNFPFPPAILGRRAIDFFTAAFMLQTLALALALFVTIRVPRPVANFDPDLFPISGILVTIPRFFRNDS